MHYRITDSRLAGEELILDLDEDEAEDPDDPQVNETHAQEIIDWWSEYPGRNAEIHDDGGHIILVDTDDDHDRTPTIGTWCQEDSDELWPLTAFPFTSLSYEAVPTEDSDTASSGSRQHYIDTGRYLTHAEVAEHQALNPREA